MKSVTPVFLHDLLDQPMLDYTLDSLCDYNITLAVLPNDVSLYDKYKTQLKIKTSTSEKDTYKNILQQLPKEQTSLICNGNTPMIEPSMVKQFVSTFENNASAVATLTYNTIPTGFFLCKNDIFDKHPSFDEILQNEDIATINVKGDNDFFPITNRYELSIAENNLRLDIIKKHLFNGVSIKNMDSVTIGPKVAIGQETIIYPNTYITGKTNIGEGCKLGPFLRIRQSATLDNGVKIGNFVELKNAKMGKKSASAHLSYLGDCTIGEEVNIGCGVITVNYDGANKHHTTIEDDAFIGCNANLVAPVTVGKSSMVAAGSTITKNIPEETLAFGRARQINKSGFKRKRKQK